MNPLESRRAADRFLADEVRMERRVAYADLQLKPRSPAFMDELVKRLLSGDGVRKLHLLNPGVRDVQYAFASADRRGFSPKRIVWSFQ